MKVLGIIAEYNPFHNGHLYHLSHSKEIIGADFVIAVMSGNFMQRGEPALINKWERAKVAVQNGVDLVIELPVVFSCNSAELFAKGAIEILNGLGCVTHLSFGSEEGKLEELESIAHALAFENDFFRRILKTNMDLGLSFPKARENAINAVLGKDNRKVVKGSNNILGIEYLKQLEVTNSKIIPVTLKRKGPGYHENINYGNIASATYIRNISGNNEEIMKYVPKCTMDSIVQQDSLLYLEDFKSIIFSKLLQQTRAELKNIYSISEGLENRIKNEIRNCSTLDELIQAVISKRYTETRMKRVLCHSLLGIDKEKVNNIINNKINYCRVLGFSGNGAKLLHTIKNQKLNTLPIITNMNKQLNKRHNAWPLLDVDILASDLYNIIAKAKLYENSDYVVRPFN